MPKKHSLEHGVLDLEAGTFLPASGPPVSLTPQEHRLCCWLAQHPGQPVSRQTLLQKVLEYAPGVNSRAVDYAVFRIRAKIEANPAAPKVLVTCYGKGYKLELPTREALDQRWIELLGPGVDLQSALQQALALLPERTVVTLLQQQGVIALGPAAHASLVQVFERLDDGARQDLIRLLPWRYLSDAVLGQQGVGLLSLGQLLQAGLLHRTGDRLVVPVSIRKTLLPLVSSSEFASAARSHADWVESQLAVGWPIGPTTLLFDNPVPAYSRTLFEECREAMAHEGPLGRRTLRVLTDPLFTSNKEVLEIAETLQHRTQGKDQWDMAARIAHRWGAQGHAEEARQKWHALAEQARDNQWPHRRLAATLHSKRNTPALDGRTIDTLMAEADEVGAHSVSFMLRLFSAKRAGLAEVDAKASEAVRFARTVGSPWFEALALTTGLAAFRFGQTAAAIPHLRRAVELSRVARHPGLEAQALNNLAVCLSDCGELDEAVEMCREAIRLAERSELYGKAVTGWSTLGSILHSLGRLDEAGRAYMEATSRVPNPRMTVVFALQACVEADLGEVVSAEASLVRVTDSAYRPFVRLAQLHIELAREGRVEQVRAQLTDLAEDLLFGTWLYVDFRLARNRLSRTLARFEARPGGADAVQCPPPNQP